jgi:ATP-binding cassette subfamily G (WHITE) protein 2 (SNQ2)
MSNQSDSHSQGHTEHTSSRTGTPSTSVSIAAPHADHSEAEPPPPTAVNVDEAKEEFRRLERQLSRISQTSKSKPSRIDLEKGTAGGEQGEAFDLREYLSSANDANARAGIKHKHVGVTWEDLEVSVFGGANQKVIICRLLFYYTAHPALSDLCANFWEYVFLLS